MTGNPRGLAVPSPEPRLRVLHSHGNSWDGLLGLQVSQPLLPVEGWGSWRTNQGLCLDSLQGAGKLASEGGGARGSLLFACASPTSFTSIFSETLRYSSTQINKEI